MVAFVARLRSYDLLEMAASADSTAEPELRGPWIAPTIERQAEPLQNVMVSAFDPSIPLAE